MSKHAELLIGRSPNAPRWWVMAWRGKEYDGMLHKEPFYDKREARAFAETQAELYRQLGFDTHISESCDVP